MSYCHNCGGQVEATHHYCSACGQALSTTAKAEREAPMAVDRAGFLSLRSLAYISALLTGDQSLDRDSVSYTQLQREVNGALSDFARLAMVEDLNLLLLWAGDSSAPTSETPVEEMTTQQYQDWLAHTGLVRTLQLYDDALGTELRDAFNEQLQDLLDSLQAEIDADDEAEGG